MAGHAAAACKAPPPVFLPAGSVFLPGYRPRAPPPAGHQPSRPQPSEAEVQQEQAKALSQEVVQPSEAEVQQEQAKALSQEVVQPKQEGLSLARSTALLYYDGESLPTITYPCEGLPFTTMDQGGCPMKAIPKELPAGYKAAAWKSPPPILLPDYRPRAPAATVAAVDEPPAAPPPPFPQMQ
jgi:hypothetical protein